MKLLILGNHTCGNRGDSAIMRGLLDAIRQQAPEAEMDVMSRFPVSSAWLQGRPIIADPLYQLSQKQQAAAGLNGRVKKYYAVVFSIKFYCLKSPRKDRCVILLSRRNLPNSRNLLRSMTPSFRWVVQTMSTYMV